VCVCHVGAAAAAGGGAGAGAGALVRPVRVMLYDVKEDDHWRTFSMSVVVIGVIHFSVAEASHSLVDCRRLPQTDSLFYCGVRYYCPAHKVARATACGLQPE
jgi:hypothetical protein